MIRYPRGTDPNTVLSNMVEVEFVDGPEQGFRKVKESLERIGIPRYRDKTLFQSVHVFHKGGRYYICHFLEMFALDGRQVEMSEEDVSRRNYIIKLLKEWHLVEPLDTHWQEPMGLPNMAKVLKYSEKEEWTLCQKYAIGKKKRVYTKQ